MVEDVLAAAAIAVAGITILLLWRRGRSSPEYVSLVEMANTVWEQQVDHEPAATLEVAAEQDVAVYADPTELRGLLVALFENAVVHGPADGTVRLERTDEGFAVADRGPGIPEGEREQVFEFGYTTRPDRDGLGLGLVYSVCATHDWEAEVTDSDSGGVRIVVSGVEYLTDWEDGDDTAGTRDGGDSAAETRDGGDDVDTLAESESGAGDGDGDDQQESTDSGWASPDN